MTTKHAGANYKRLLPFIEAVDATPDKHFRFEADGYMPLSIENVGYTFGGSPVYSMMHYYVQCGDLVRDPEMTFAVLRGPGEIIPLSYCQSSPPIFQEVYYDGGGWRYSLLLDLDEFLFEWIKNILSQGFDPNQAANAAKSF